MKYVIYTRVSDKKQDDGTSPETQLEDCLRVVGNKPYIHIHDTAKGWLPTEKRPRLLKATSQIEKGDIFICRSPDRLSRNSEEIGVIKALVRKNKGTIEVVYGSLISEDISPQEWMAQKIQSLMPEYEVRLLSWRVGRAYAKKRENEESMGFARFGYKNCDGQIIRDEAEQSTLALMIDLRKKGKSLRYIVNRLNDAQLYNTVGKPWAYESVRRVLNRELSESENPLTHV